MHWRDHFNSSLLGAYSLYDEQTDDFKTIDGLIINAKTEEHILGASGKRMILVAYTSLDAKKPMKINVTIAKTISLIARSQSPEKWVNVPVTFYVDKRVNTKEGVVEALRVRPQAVRPATTQASPTASQAVTEAQILSIKSLLNSGDSTKIERAEKSFNVFCKPPYVLDEKIKKEITELITFIKA